MTCLNFAIQWYITRHHYKSGYNGTPCSIADPTHPPGRSEESGEEWREESGEELGEDFGEDLSEEFGKDLGEELGEEFDKE